MTSLGILHKHCQAVTLKGRPFWVITEPLRCTHELQKEFHVPLLVLRDYGCDKLTKSSGKRCNSDSKRTWMITAEGYYEGMQKGQKKRQLFKIHFLSTYFSL